MNLLYAEIISSEFQIKKNPRTFHNQVLLYCIAVCLLIVHLCLKYIVLFLIIAIQEERCHIMFALNDW